MRGISPASSFRDDCPFLSRQRHAGDLAAGLADNEIAAAHIKTATETGAECAASAFLLRVELLKFDGKRDDDSGHSRKDHAPREVCGSGGTKGNVGHAENRPNQQ